MVLFVAIAPAMAQQSDALGHGAVAFVQEHFSERLGGAGARRDAVPRAAAVLPQDGGGRTPISQSGVVQRVAMPEAIPPALDEAVQMVFSDFRIAQQYDYVMTGKVRLLLFWIGKDDVGGGYIRREEGADRQDLEAIRLKIGSDPDKAPRGINRWGAATEIIERDVQRGSTRSAAFFGFMKATEGDSVDAVESELEAEGDESRYMFEASINRIEPGVAFSSVLPIVSPVDFHIRQLDDADRMVREQYASAFRLSNYRRLNRSSRQQCQRSESFLFTVKEIIDAAVAGERAPLSRCYVYNSKLLELTLRDRDVVARERVEYELTDGTIVQKEHRDLIDLEFRVRNPTTGWSTDFDLLVGTTGALRGVPVRITYQPNFWFKAILNLHQVSEGLSS
jgi:hypothetical protein